MANEVLIDGWLGADPNDYSETAEKARFVKFDIAQRHSKAKLLGLKREPKPTQNLADYLAQRQVEADQQEAPK